MVNQSKHQVKPKTKHQVRRFYVFGGGCFGTQYTKWLLRSVTRGWLEFEEIWVIDPKIDCQVRQEIKDSRLEFLEMGWEDFGPQFLLDNLNSKEAEQDHWIPPHNAPHLLFHSFLKALGNIKQIDIQENLDTPFHHHLDSKDLALSFAEWRCPTNCIEPQRCPGIRKDRDWEMRERLNALQAKKVYDSLHIFDCQHLCHAVATIRIKQILEEFRILASGIKNKEIQKFAVATISSCHGLLSAGKLV